MPKSNIFALLVALGVGIAADPSAAGTPSPKAIQLTVSNPICSDPCTLVVRVEFDLEQIPAKTWVCLGLRDNFPHPRRVSCWPHDGAKQTEVRVRDIPEGLYEVIIAAKTYKDVATLEVH